MTLIRSQRQPTTSGRANGTTAAAIPWRRMVAVVGWLVLLAAVVWGMQRLDAQIRTAQAGVPCRLEWVELPVWLTTPSNEAVLRNIAGAAGLQPDDTIDNPDLVRRVGAGLRGSPWIAEVKRVVRVPDGRICVDATFREPFAFIEADGVAYLVDAAGVRLPHRQFVAYMAEQYWDDWLRITGVSGPLPNEGEAWSGEDVAAGLRLVQYLKQAGARGEVPFRPLLRAIDVANIKRRENNLDGELRLRTIHPRSYIAWGLPPEQEFDVEASAARKLELLRAYYSELGGQLPDGWVYDVRNADRIWRWAYKR